MDVMTVLAILVSMFVLKDLGISAWGLLKAKPPAQRLLCLEKSVQELDKRLAVVQTDVRWLRRRYEVGDTEDEVRVA